MHTHIYTHELYKLYHTYTVKLPKKVSWEVKHGTTSSSLIYLYLRTKTKKISKKNVHA